MYAYYKCNYILILLVLYTLILKVLNFTNVIASLPSDELLDDIE